MGPRPLGHRPVGDGLGRRDREHLDRVAPRPEQPAGDARGGVGHEVGVERRHVLGARHGEHGVGLVGRERSLGHQLRDAGLEAGSAGHRGAGAGGDGVAPHAVGPEVAGHRPGQAHDGTLGRGVGGPGVVAEPRVGAGGDDGAPPLLGHQRRGVAAAVERPVEVDGQQAAPVGGVDVDDGVPTGRRHAGHAQQPVDRAEPLDARGHQLAGVVEVLHGAHAGDGPAASGGVDPVDHRQQGPGVGAACSRAVDHDVGALGRHPHGDRLADAAAGAGDDDVAPRQRSRIGHRVSSVVGTGGEPMATG